MINIEWKSLSTSKGCASNGSWICVSYNSFILFIN